MFEVVDRLAVQFEDDDYQRLEKRIERTAKQFSSLNGNEGEKGAALLAITNLLIQNSQPKGFRGQILVAILWTEFSAQDV
jgi:hypothetical protein